MAIRATYNTGAITINNAVIKLDRIWGSKKEQWNAWVHVFRSESDSTPVEVFSVSAQYVEGENPYVALYDAVSKLNTLSDVVSDVGVAPKVKAAETSEQDVEEKQSTKKNKKK